MSNEKIDRIVAVLLLAFSVFIFVVGARIPQAQANAGGGPGPGAFPMFLGSVLAMLSVALFFFAGRKKKKEEPKEAAQAKDEVQELDETFRAKALRVVSCMILIAVYIVILPYLGFVASTILFSIGFLIVLYRKKVKETLIPSICITLFVFAIFDLALSIPLPAFMEAVK